MKLMNLLKEMKDKTIIFGAPKAYNVSDEIVKNLRHLGFEVIDVSFPQEFQYKNPFQKVYNFLRKIVMGNSDYKKNLRIKPYRRCFEEAIKSLPKKADYALFVRPDVYPKSFLSLVKKYTLKTYGYQWDGLGAFPDGKRYTKYFDSFFVFDPADVKTSLKPTTNFYFDYDLKTGDNYHANSVYFLGSFSANRMKPISCIGKIIKQLGFECNILILTKEEHIIQQHKNSEAKFIKDYISFEDNLRNMRNAEVLIDFINGKHSGLSFRTFEAIGNDKKLITNNTDIKKYDFYNPNNFYVWENDDDFDGLEAFLLKPYQPIEQNIKQKYSFSNWIRYILDIEPHQKIELPV